jgi:hypothetical protein
VYQPAYKLNADFLLDQVDDPDTRAIVQLDAGQSWESLVAGFETVSSDLVDYTELGPYIDVSVTVPRSRLRALATDPRIVAIEPLGVANLSDERSCQIVAGNHDTQQATNAGLYLSNWFHTVCGGCIYDLSSYIVNVVDTGLDNGSAQPIHQDIATRVNSWHDYYNANDTSSQPSHGEMVAGIIGGYAASGLKDPAGFYYGMGIAPTARLRISKVFNFAEYTVLTPAVLKTVTTNAYDSGSYFQNQSWNFHNPSSPFTAIVDYEAYAQMVDYLVRDAYGLNAAIRPMFISTAAGNLGEFPNPSVCPLCVRTPASAKNAVAMGASTLKRDEATPCTNANNPLSHVATLSARASQDVNRYKPEFVAPGTRIVSLQTQNTAPNYSGVCSDSLSGIVPSTSNLYGFGSGTSYSTPLASGAAAILARYFHQRLGTADPSPAMIKAMMVVGGETMNLGTDDQTTLGLGQVPSHVYGWGRLGLQRIFDGIAVKALDEDHAVTPVRRFTASGQQYNFVYTVSNTGKPIRFVMAFTDAAGAIGSGNNPFVNHISTAIFQGGKMWCDNGAIDSDGYTIPSTLSCGFPDLDNNVKYVNVRPGSFSGQFTVNVTSGGVNGKAVPGLDGSSNNQDFALFVYNAQ